MSVFNIYCDESCHLEHDKIKLDNRYMIIGGISCPNSLKKEVFKTIKTIKKAYGLSSMVEVKWTKVSMAKINAYKALINYFFDVNELRFRSVIIDKTKLNHNKYNHTHDDFYYKIYWLMLDWFIESNQNQYNIFLDKKDTQGVEKIKSLHNVICNSNYDFDRNIINNIQEVESHDVSLLQIADLLIGAVSYAKRYPDGGKSQAKNEIVELVKARSTISLDKSTTLGANRFNLLHWEGF